MVSFSSHLFPRLLCFLLVGLLSCTEFVAIPGPETELNKDNVFEDDATASAALAGIYSSLSQQSSFAAGGNSSVTYLMALYADELTSSASGNSTTASSFFYFNNVFPTNDLVSSIWGGAYKVIYSCNTMLEGLDRSTAITPALRDQLKGEAYFLRAFCHFYLLNLFGDVPLVLSSDYRGNAHVFRTPADAVYAAIKEDLLSAKGLLKDGYPSEGRFRVNKGAAIALLSRVYLYTEDYANAEVAASEIISKTSQFKLGNVDEIFLKSTETLTKEGGEAIWQLLPRGGIERYTYEGFLFIQTAPAAIALQTGLRTNFEKGDLRKLHWVDSITSTSGLTKWFFPYKYKETSANATGGEASMVLRLAEQYLIRAEARAQQGRLTGADGAEGDVNIMRNRAGLPEIVVSGKKEMLEAIAHERRVEFFSEWGHRFFDLKRTGLLNEALSNVKSNWNSHDTYLPLPQSEVLANINLKQNDGY